MDKITYSTPLARDAMAYVLAGGRGSRLMELTDRRAKPAVYFGGKSRIIDFALSNALNSGIRRIGVATQYKAHSLIRHLQRGWNFLQPEAQRELRHPAGEPARLRGPVVRGHRRRGLPEHRHHRQLRARVHRHPGRRSHLQDGLRADARQHVDAGADVTVGCLEVPRRGDRLRRHACRREPTASSRSSRSRRIRRGCPTARAGRSPPWASTSSDASSCSSSCAATPRIRTRAAISARTSFRTSSRTARRSRTASRESCVRSRAEGGAYWRDVGTVDAYWEANIDLTDVVPALDLYDRDWPIWTYAEITPPAKFVHDEDGRRGVGDLVAGLGRLHRLGRRRCGARCCSPACACNSYGSVENAVVLPYVEIGRRVRLTQRRHRRGVRIPEGLVVGEDPELDAARFRRTDAAASASITQPMIDRLDRDVSVRARPRRSPRRSFRWSRPAASPTSSARCRAALAREGIAMRTLVPGLSGGAWTRCDGAETVAHASPSLHGGPARLARAARRRARSPRARRAASLRAAGQSLSSAPTARTGPTTRCASRRSRTCAAAIARGAVAGFAPDVVHAHDWQAGLAPALPPLRRRAAPGHGA